MEEQEKGQADFMSSMFNSFSMTGLNFESKQASTSKSSKLKSDVLSQMS